ncbi:hypothetical protein AMELA_G00042100 [Ameiurus melas]|uniref:Uncharacterized protein n=1 Tax=Ameiurus melas TaxID=219545 RepID=A0A7J6B9X8_AMEME|nr:hypothetical protein AMELA_G00042100 [Ameiurus melas]
MEDCVRLVCETLGVHTGDEVSVEEIAVLYQKVFHTDAELRDAQRAVTQVSSQNGGLPCSGGWILHVLLEMEKEREKREKLHWELQMLKSGQRDVSDRANTQPLSGNFICKHKKKRDTKPCGLLGLLRRARRLYVRLDVDGVWSILPSLSLSHVTSRRLGLINPTKSDVLLLLQYKYDIIKERLYREMLQEEHVGFDGVLSDSELLTVTVDDRSDDEVVLHSGPDEARVREQVWTTLPREQSWTSAIFLSELRSHCEEERHTLTQLLNRVERRVLIEIYLSVCVSVRRAERETHSHTALLTSRQHWDHWPYTRRPGVEDLVKFWLQKKQDLATQPRNECRTSCCVRQEQERRTLVEILHSVSLKELQEQRYTLTPDYKAAGTTGSALRRGCVSILRQIKSSLHCSSTHSSVSWADCAVHLLTQLTHTHDEEVQSVIHTLPVMDAAALLVLLHKYELELRSPKLHNLHNLLQTSGRENTQINVSVTDSERTEQRQETPSVSEEQEICTGCGVVLVPEDAPYLEILGIGEKRDDVQERLSIVQNRKSDEDLLGLRREETFRHLTNTLQQEDEQQQKVLVREKLQQLWRERSYILQSRRER